MGCDIHVSVQVKNSEGKWEEVGTNAYSKQKDQEDPFYLEYPFHRSYDLFSVLAGVRNYSNVTPISEPRGVPQDIRDDYDNWYRNAHWADAYDCQSLDDYLVNNYRGLRYEMHSESWLSLRELEEYDWTQKVMDVRDNNTEMSVREFVGETTLDSILASLRKLGTPDDVRMVFGFDN